LIHYSNLKAIICPTPFVVDYTTSRPIMAHPVDPADRALEVSGALIEAGTSPSALDEFSCGGSATITVVVTVLGLVVALAIAIGSAIYFRRRAVEAETSVKSKSR
jgi:hypothetical protein